MSVDHVLDLLVAAAAVSPEQADAARAVQAGVASTAAGRLEACGLDGDAMLAAVAQVSGIAVAPAALIARARRIVVKGGDPSVLRRLLAFPAGADKSRVLDVLVADPESATHLPHLGLPDYRVWLASERVLRELIAKLPEGVPEIATGVDDQMRMLRALDYDTAPVHTGLELGGAASEDQEQFVTNRDLQRAPARAAVPSAANLPPLPVPAAPGAPTAPEWPAPLARAPTPHPAPPRQATPATAPPRSATPPPAPQRAPTPPAARPPERTQSAATFSAAVADLPPAITLLPMLHEAGAEAPVAQAAPLAPLAKPAHAPARGSRRGMWVPLGAGVMVLGLGAVVVVLMMGREAAPAADEGAKRQAQLLQDARTRAAAGDHAWAFSACTGAIAAKPGTSLAVDAALICARERIALGERLDAVEELRKLVATLPATDQRRAQAEELLRSIVGPPP